jgi:putative ABC transport system permease protein
MPNLAIHMTLLFPVGVKGSNVLVHETPEGIAKLLVYLGLNGYQASTLNWASFSQISFAFTVTPELLVTGLGYSLILGLVGGLLPGLRAARMPIAAGLREL